MINNLYDYPQLRSDGTCNDFLDTVYVNRATVDDCKADVVNRLSGDAAGVLTGLLKKGQAGWMIEVRSPAALYSETHWSDQSDTKVVWDSALTGDSFNVYLVSQMVALEDVSIDSGLLHPIWRTHPSVVVPAGALLAQGNVLTAEPLTSSILKFVPVDTLPDGMMEVSEPDESIRFTVKIAAGLRPGLYSRRDLHLGALIAAMGKLNRVEHDPEESRVLRSISDRLLDQGIPDWMSDDYDAALAATALEKFAIVAEDEQ